MAVGVPGTFGPDLGSEKLDGILGALGFFFWLTPVFVVVFVLMGRVIGTQVARQSSVFSRKEIETTLNKGVRTNATVIGSSIDEAFKDGAVYMRTLTMRVDGAQVAFSAFRSGFERLSNDDVIEVLYHPEVPALAIPTDLCPPIVDEIRRDFPVALETVTSALPPDFPTSVVDSIGAGARARLRLLE